MYNCAQIHQMSRLRQQALTSHSINVLSMAWPSGCSDVGRGPKDVAGFVLLKPEASQERIAGVCLHWPSIRHVSINIVLIHTICEKDD